MPIKVKLSPPKPHEDHMLGLVILITRGFFVQVHESGDNEYFTLIFRWFEQNTDMNRVIYQLNATNKIFILTIMNFP